MVFLICTATARMVVAADGTRVEYVQSCCCCWRRKDPEVNLRDLYDIGTASENRSASFFVVRGLPLGRYASRLTPLLCRAAPRLSLKLSTWKPLPFPAGAAGPEERPKLVSRRRRGFLQHSAAGHAWPRWGSCSSAAALRAISSPDASAP
jgi:hypothetical protein